MELIDNIFKKGDYVTIELAKGYFIVEDNILVQSIDPCTKEPEVRSLLVLKKALNVKFECKNLTYGIYSPHWCKKVDDETKAKIEQVFMDNPKAKGKFEDYKFTLINLLQLAVLVDEEQRQKLFKTIEEIKDKKITEQEVYNLEVIKNNKFNGGYCDVKDNKRVVRLSFINENVERNEDNWYLYKFNSYREELEGETL